MVDRIDMARQIIEETCPDRRLHLENIQMFAEIIECRKFAKGDVIINEGDVCTSLYYVAKGLTRQHYVKNEKDMTEHLSCEGGVVWCIESGILAEMRKRYPHKAFIPAPAVSSEGGCRAFNSQYGSNQIESVNNTGMPQGQKRS